LNRDGFCCGVGFGSGEADALLVLGEGLLVVVLGEGLLVVALGDALLVGDIVVVVWAAAGVLGCTSASQLRSAMKPAANTNATTINVNHLRSILSVFYGKGFASYRLMSTLRTWQMSRYLMKQWTTYEKRARGYVLLSTFSGLRA
jgi:hypothetical protein